VSIGLEPGEIGVHYAPWEVASAQLIRAPGVYFSGLSKEGRLTGVIFSSLQKEFIFTSLCPLWTLSSSNLATERRLFVDIF